MFSSALITKLKNVVSHFKNKYWDKDQDDCNKCDDKDGGGGVSAPNVITGTSNGEHINGGARNDTINGLAGNDFINGGACDDILDGGSGSDRVDGDSGNDTLVYDVSENQNGSKRFSDRYDGGSGCDTLKLVLTEEQAADPVLQQEIAAFKAFIQANTLPNGEAKNVEFTFESLCLTVTRIEKIEVEVKPDDCDCDDAFVINANTVIINGTAGDDRIIATEGDQTIYGLAGNDTIAGRSGNDQLSGGNGNDTIAGDVGDDIICGGDGDDYLLGNRSNDQLYGGKGNDQLYGGENDDVVFGGYGNDFLSGDEGDDVLYGDQGSDVFAYGKLEGTLEFGNDVIADFELASSGNAGDKIQIVNLGDEFDTYAEIMAVADQTADGVLFDFGNDRSLLVEDVTIASLTSDYFLF